MRLTRFALLLAVAALAWPTAAAGQESGSNTPGSVRAPVIGGELPERPPELHLSAREAIRIADRDPNVRETQAGLKRNLKAYAQAKLPDAWQIGYYDGDDEVVQVIVDDPTESVRESWTGEQVAWQMARGYEGQFGHLLNAPYVWIPLAALFFLGLFDFRRPRKMVHLDLLVLLSFGVSQIFFDAGSIGVSVPLTYPPLLYLLARMLWVGFRGPGEGLRPSVPVSWLVIVAMFLIGFRVALNVADSGVIDVGYAGVIGADKVTHGDPIWSENGTFPEDNRFGDTYGPANYYAYVPFEAALPWHGEWDDLPSGHAAAIFFDLAAIVGLFLLGRRLRMRASDDEEPADRHAADLAADRARMEGNALGATLAFAWVAYPYTDYALQSNANDTLVAALLIWAFVFFASPVGRGVLLAAASLVKFAPLALAPLFFAGERGLADRLPLRRPGGGRRAALAARPLIYFSLAFLATAALLLAWPAADPGLATLYERTLQSQLDRESPFSIWGQTDLEWLQDAVKAAALGLAILVAFIPRRRNLQQLAALSAAVLIAAQLGIDHWFYLYLPWFFGLVVVAAVSQTREPAPG